MQDILEHLHSVGITEEFLDNYTMFVWGEEVSFYEALATAIDDGDVGPFLVGFLQSLNSPHAIGVTESGDIFTYEDEDF